MKILLRISFVALLLAASSTLFQGCIQRRLLYFPTHDAGGQLSGKLGLVRWEIDGEYTGYSRNLKNPRKIWFFIHGNGGQAVNRDYLFTRLSSDDSVYILEYPGYGERSGQPSRKTLDAAALKAFNWLVATYGVERIVVLGESLGSGPASSLAAAPIPPRHIVLVVPFDVLRKVAQEKYRFLPVGLLMVDDWDNIAALGSFKGRLDIFGGRNDNVIPVHHAQNLARAHPGAIYHEFEGGHGWANGKDIDLSKL